MFNIVRFCHDKKCQQQIEFNKIKTSGNDPSISKKMRYSQITTQFNGRSLNYADLSNKRLLQTYGLPSPNDIEKLNSNATIVTNSSIFS